MSTHKFEYVVAGVSLSDEQKTAISNAIGLAVGNELLRGAGTAALVKGHVWGAAGHPNGGRLALALKQSDLGQYLAVGGAAGGVAGG